MPLARGRICLRRAHVLMHVNDMDVLPAAIRALDGHAEGHAAALSSVALACQRILAVIAEAVPHGQFRSIRDVVYAGRHVLEPADKNSLQDLNPTHGFLRHIPDPEIAARVERISKDLGTDLSLL